MNTFTPPRESGATLRPYYEDAHVTIYHGDMFDVIPHLSGIGAVVTDPPYSSGGAFRGDRMVKTSDKYVQTSTTAYRPEFAGDNRDQRSFAVWMALWLNACRNSCVPGAPVVCFTDWRQLPTTVDAIQVGGWIYRGIAVWSKKFGRPMPGRFSSACEFAPWGSNGPMPERDEYPPGIYNEALTPENVFDEAFEHASPAGDMKQHIAQKPEAVMKWLLRVVPPGFVALDPFMGSGTTLRAAKSMGLKAIGIDCDERYCEMAAARLTQGVLF